jgi:hypothetical protein
MKRTTRLMACTAVLALASGVLLGCRTPDPGPGPGPTDPGPTQPGPGPGPGPGGDAKGPNPTEALLTAARGPFQITQTRGNGSGFASGTVYYPTDTSLGRMGAIVVVPGFMSVEAQMAWWGPRLASHGFVAMVIGTNTVMDVPGSRAQQQNAALRWLSTQSPVANRIDPTRLAAGGWSMGGGGSLMAAQSNPNIKVVVPMAPWNPGMRYTYNKPTIIMSCSSDAIAGNGANSNVHYAGLTGPKGQITVSGSHFCPTSTNTVAARYVVAWMKRFLDGDTRYQQFVCTPRSGYRNANAGC